MRRTMRGFSPERLADVRTRVGISQRALARQCGLNANTIRRWETGESSPQPDLLARALRVLGSEMDEVVRVPVADRFPGDWRVQRGLTQRQLGELAGVAPQNVSGIELGEIPLSEATAKKLAKVLDLSISEYRASYDRARARPAGMSV